MASTIHQIIGKVVPGKYASNGSALLKKYKSPKDIPAEEVEPNSQVTHKLVLDSPTSSLEPIYFYILDLMSDIGLAPQKVVDTFTSSPGSGHFSELGQKATAMQQQASKLMSDINTVLRSILNLLYDLKEFKIRLELYADTKSKDNNKKYGAYLALKQLWMDKVDINKGQSSIKAMGLSPQAGFSTLIDAFLFAKNVEEAKKLDLNERIKRIVAGRISEFNKWIVDSEKELQKRFDLEKIYLKSQVDSLKLYARWAKPYFLAAQKLEMFDGGKNPALVHAFNTAIFQLTLFGKTKLNVGDAVLSGRISPEVGKIKSVRDYYSCVVVDLSFRGIPQKISQQNYAFGGKTEILFNAYTLSADELKKVEEENEKSDAFDLLELVKGATTDSLEQIKNDMKEFIDVTKPAGSDDGVKKTKDQSNPILALVGYYNKNGGGSSSKAGKKPKPENYIEKTYLRPLAEEDSIDKAFTLFDVYKKAHQLESYT